MKSAYELAMERLGGAREYTDETKEKLADIDRRYDARVAEVRLHAEEKAATLKPGSDEIDELRANATRDIARLEEKRESEKEAVRKQN